MESQRPYGVSFVAPGNPGPPGALPPKSAKDRLRELVARRRPNKRTSYYGSAIVIDSVQAEAKVSGAYLTSYWSDEHPVFTVPDAKLSKFTGWAGDPGPSFNAQTGGDPINAFTIETIVSSRAAGVISIMIFAGTAGGDMIFMIDDETLSEGFIDLPSNLGGVGQINLKIAANLQGRRLTVRMPSTIGFFGLLYDQSIVLTPTPNKPVNVALVSDSMGQSQAYPLGADGKYYPSSAGQDLCYHLEQKTGWAWWCMAQGSTGPLYAPSGSSLSPYSSTLRLNALAELHAKHPFNLITILGSVNDGGNKFGLPAYKAGLKAYYAKLDEMFPKVPLLVIGPESGITFGYTDVAILNQATKEACAESANVAMFLDYYGENWFSGTGAVDAPARDGNFDVAQSTDRVHLSAYGKKMLAGKINDGLEKV